MTNHNSTAQIFKSGLLFISLIKNKFNFKSSNLKLSHTNKGFTLIELLVVIAIIGAMASVVVFTYPAIQKRSRDTARKSDLNQYRTSLEAYANRTEGLYPIHAVNPGIKASSVLCTDMGSANCPEDPKNPSDNTFEYKYQSDGTGNTGNPGASQYVLWVKLENSTDYWVVCSSGKSFTKAQTGFSVSGGNCPP